MIYIYNAKNSRTFRFAYHKETFDNNGTCEENKCFLCEKKKIAGTK